MRLLCFIAVSLLLVGCETPTVGPYANDKYKPLFEREERQGYREGVGAAKADLKRGVLAYEDIQCEEEEGWQKLWVFRKLLADKYHVDYRVISPSPVPEAVGRMRGYDSITEPLVVSRLGKDWFVHIQAEADAYYGDHWAQVAPLYQADRDAHRW